MLKEQLEMVGSLLMTGAYILVSKVIKLEKKHLLQKFPLIVWSPNNGLAPKPLFSHCSIICHQYSL